jgi:hypothetical protein
MTTRRTILKGLAATAAGLILPPTLAENAEAVRRYWALDRTMLSLGYETPTLIFDGTLDSSAFARLMREYFPVETASLCRVMTEALARTSELPPGIVG